MMRGLLAIVLLLGMMRCFSAYAQTGDEPVDMSGISIIGNRELPKTLFIVPWKNSEVGVESEFTNNLDEGLRPIDREVFVRELDYYEFSQGSR